MRLFVAVAVTYRVCTRWPTSLHEGEMQHHALPIVQQIMLDIFAPPILAIMWWLFSRGWAGTIQGGEVSQMTKDRQAKGFWIVLITLYVIMFGATTYFNLIA